MDFISAVIVAGGMGKRMGSKTPKQFLSLKNKPILYHTIKRLGLIPEINEIIIVLPEDHISWFENEIMPKLDIDKKIKITMGGLERQNSVKNGLEKLDKKSSMVLIHDGVRPFVTKTEIKKLIDRCKKTGAVIPGVPVVETIKKCNGDKLIRKTISRENLFLAQTPQVFKTEVLKKAHEKGVRENISATDDSLLLELLGMEVEVVEGSRFNIKITTPEDLEFAEMIFEKFNSEI